MYKQLIKEQLKVKASVLSADLRLTPSRFAIFIGLLNPLGHFHNNPDFSSVDFPNSGSEFPYFFLYFHSLKAEGGRSRYCPTHNLFTEFKVGLIWQTSLCYTTLETEFSSFVY